MFLKFEINLANHQIRCTSSFWCHYLRANLPRSSSLVKSEKILALFCTFKVGFYCHIWLFYPCLDQFRAIPAQNNQKSNVIGFAKEHSVESRETPEACYFYDCRLAECKRPPNSIPIASYWSMEGITASPRHRSYTQSEMTTRNHGREPKKDPKTA